MIEIPTDGPLAIYAAAPSWKVLDRETKETVSSGKHLGSLEEVVMVALAAHAIATEARKGQERPGRTRNEL